MSQLSAGTRFRQAVKESNPLAVVGCVNAYFARLATQSGFKGGLSVGRRRGGLLVRDSGFGHHHDGGCAD